MNIEAISLTSDIVTAFVSHNTLAAGDLPRLINQVHLAITGLGDPTPAPVEQPQPAVSIKASVKPDHVTCLECGTKAKMLKRHLASAHQMDESTYRKRWSLPDSHPLVAPNYAQKRRELALQIGLGRKPTRKR